MARDGGAPGGAPGSGPGASGNELACAGACGKAPRGRPRCAERHAAILSATNALLEEQSYGDVTMEAVAARAGVAKQTLYNWWPNKASLAMEAFLARIERSSPTPDTGAFASDLEGYLVGLCRTFSQGNMGPTLAGIIAETQRDPELGLQFCEHFIARRRQGATVFVQRGIERGEVRADANVEELLDMMYGPLWYRLLLRNAPLDARFARSIAAYMLASVAPGRDPPAPPAPAAQRAPTAKASRPAKLPARR